MPIQPIYLKKGPNGLNWQCCLNGSSKTAPRILIVSIAMGGDYSFEVKNMEIWVPEFFKHNNSSAATVDLDVLLICLITNWENHENFKSDSLKKCYEIIKTVF